MIEKKIIEYLSDEMDVPVYAESPLNPPDSYVVIEKTRGTEDVYMGEATIAIQSFAASMYDASALNETIKEAMATMPDDVDIVPRVRLNSNYNFTDQTKKKYRYQAVFDISYFV